MFEDQQNQKAVPGAGPVPPPPLDPEQVQQGGQGVASTGSRKAPAPTQIPQQNQGQQPLDDPFSGADRMPQPPRPGAVGAAQKDWGPWKPKTNPGYNPPDTPQEIKQVLNSYGAQNGQPPAGGQGPIPSPSPRGSGKRWFIIIVIIVIALVIGAAVFAYFQFFRDSGTEATNNTTNVVNENVNSTANSNTGGNSNTTVNTNTVNSNTANVNTTNTSSNLNTNVVSNTNTSSNANTTNTNTANVNSNLNDDDTNAAKDSDNDGLTDFLELIYGTDPNNPDTDGDGFLDGQEVQNNYDPKGPGTL